MDTLTALKAVNESDSASRSTARKAVRRLRRLILPVSSLLVFLTIWEFLPVLLDTPEYVVPRLSRVLSVFANVDTLQLYLHHGLVTVTEAMVGLAFGTLVGFVLGVLFAQLDWLYRTFYPYIVSIQAVPKVALAPLFVVWLGFGVESTILVVFLLTLFPILVNTIAGMRSASEDSVDLFRVIGAPRMQTLFRLLIPGAMPSFLSGFEVAVVNSMLGAIVGEFVGAQAGLGLLILQAQFHLNVAAVFSILIVLAVYGVTMNFLVRKLRRRVLFWMPLESQQRGRSA